MDQTSQLIAQIADLGPILPGTLEKHFNVCGKAGCRCKDKVDPKKHGPYSRLSYSLGGKNSSMFVKEEDAKTVEQMTDNYRRLRDLTMQLALSVQQSVRDVGVDAVLRQYPGIGKIGQKADACKEKLQIVRSELRAAQVRIRDLTASRDKWKQACARHRERNLDIERRLASSEDKARSMEEVAAVEKKREVAPLAADTGLHVSG